MSEHDALIAALRDIADVLERIDRKLGAPVNAEPARMVLSLGAVAKRLRRRYADARELVESGAIPGRCEGGRWYVLAEDVEAYQRAYVDGAA